MVAILRGNDANLGGDDRQSTMPIVLNFQLFILLEARAVQSTVTKGSKAIRHNVK